MIGTAARIIDDLPINRVVELLQKEILALARQGLGSTAVSLIVPEFPRWISAEPGSINVDEQINTSLRAKLELALNMAGLPATVIAGYVSRRGFPETHSKPQIHKVLALLHWDGPLNLQGASPRDQLYTIAELPNNLPIGEISLNDITPTPRA